LQIISLYAPDSADMRIALKDLHFQPSFPKMNRGRYATDSRTNDADRLDVEVVIYHCFKRRLVMC
jgi:hypothetical protein